MECLLVLGNLTRRSTKPRNMTRFRMTLRVGLINWPCVTAFRSRLSVERSTQYLDWYHSGMFLDENHLEEPRSCFLKGKVRLTHKSLLSYRSPLLSRRRLRDDTDS